MLTAAEVRELLWQRSAPSNTAPTGSNQAQTEAVQFESIRAPKPPRPVTGANAAATPGGQKVAEKRTFIHEAMPERKKKARVEVEPTIGGDAKEVLVPKWDVGVMDTMFNAEGQRANPVDLLQGIFLPEDRKRLSLYKSTECIRALAALTAKVVIAIIIFMCSIFLIMADYILSCRARLGSAN